MTGMVGVVVTVVVLTVCACLAALVALRADRQLRTRIAALPGVDEPVAFWPVNVDDEYAGPYLRGASVAAGLTGRR